MQKHPLKVSHLALTKALTRALQSNSHTHSRNQSQKLECLRAVPDRCSAYQSLNRRKIVILHRNYIQKQNRAKSLPTTYLHNKVSFLLKSYFLPYEPHKNIQKTILITLFGAHSSSRSAICSQKNSFASCYY